MNLAAVRIFVWDLEEAKVFYGETLGLQIRGIGSRPGFLVFDAHACDLVVEQVAPDAPSDERALVGRFTGLSFNVNNIEQRCAQLEKQGVPFTGRPERQAWGGTLATLQDPAGNELQLVEYPRAT